MESSIDEDTRKSDIGKGENFSDKVNGLVEQTKFLLERANKSKNTLQESTAKTKELSKRARDQDKILRQVIGQLQHYINYASGKQDKSIISTWIQEANYYVDAMKERGIYIEKRYNRGNTDFQLAILNYHYDL